MRKLLIFIVICTCLNLFGIKDEFVLYPESIDPISKSYSKEYLEEHFVDYKKFYDKIGCKSPDHFPMLVSNPYYNKIDLKKYKEFKKIGLDLVEFSKNNFAPSDIYERSVNSQLIFTGTIVNRTYVTDPSSHYHEYYTIQVDEIIKGNDLFDSKIDFIDVYQTTGIQIVKVKEKVRIDTIRNMSSEFDFGKIDEKYIFFSGFKGEDFERKYKNWAWIPKGRGKVYVDETDYIEVEIKDPVDFTDRKNLRHAGFVPFDKEKVTKLKEFLEKYEKINDTPNFYKRSYK